MNYSFLTCPYQHPTPVTGLSHLVSTDAVRAALYGTKVSVYHGLLGRIKKILAQSSFTQAAATFRQLDQRISLGSSLGCWCSSTCMTACTAANSITGPVEVSKLQDRNHPYAVGTTMIPGGNKPGSVFFVSRLQCPTTVRVDEGR
jgi:hypothetical protein